MATKHITVPEGAELRVSIEPGDVLDFSFDLTSASFERKDDDLALLLDGGARIVFADFFIAGEEGGRLPLLKLKDGTEIDSADFLLAIDPDFDVTASGPRLESSGGEYEDGAGDMTTGVERMGSGGTSYWDPVSENGDEAVSLGERYGMSAARPIAEAPSMPGMPDRPGGNPPEIPGTPDTPTIPGRPDVPTPPDTPDPPDIPDTPDTPDTPPPVPTQTQRFVMYMENPADGLSMAGEAQAKYGPVSLNAAAGPQPQYGVASIVNGRVLYTMNEAGAQALAALGEDGLLVDYLTYVDAGGKLHTVQVVLTTDTDFDSAAFSDPNHAAWNVSEETHASHMDPHVREVQYGQWTWVEESTIVASQGDNHLSFGDAAALTVKSFDGNDTVRIDGAMKPDFTVEFRPDGWGASQGPSSLLDLGEGDNSISVNGWAAMNVTTGSGKDVMEVNGTLGAYGVEGEYRGQLTTVYHESTEIDLGAGDDSIYVNGQISRALISMGDGADTITVDGVINESVLAMGQGEGLITVRSNGEGLDAANPLRLVSNTRIADDPWGGSEGQLTVSLSGTREEGDITGLYDTWGSVYNTWDTDVLGMDITAVNGKAIGLHADMVRNAIVNVGGESSVTLKVEGSEEAWGVRVDGGGIRGVTGSADTSGIFAITATSDKLAVGAGTTPSGNSGFNMTFEGCGADDTLSISATSATGAAYGFYNTSGNAPDVYNFETIRINVSGGQTAAGIYSPGGPGDQGGFYMKGTKELALDVSSSGGDATGIYLKKGGQGAHFLDMEHLSVTVSGKGTAAGIYAGADIDDTGTHKHSFTLKGTATEAARAELAVTGTGYEMAYGMMVERQAATGSVENLIASSGGAITVTIAVTAGTAEKAVAMWAAGNGAVNVIRGGSLSGGPGDEVSLSGRVHAENGGRNEISTGAGDDVITLHGQVTPGALNISMGAGHDELVLKAASIQEFNASYKNWLEGVSNVPGMGVEAVRVELDGGFDGQGHPQGVNGLLEDLGWLKSVFAGTDINLHLSAQDDVLTINGLLPDIFGPDFSLHGGEGTDTLVLKLGGLERNVDNFDFEGLARAATGFEVLHLDLENGSGPNDAELFDLDAMLARMANIYSGQAEGCELSTIYVTGDVGDVVSATALAQNASSTSTVEHGGVTYTQYTYNNDDGLDLTILIQNGIA